MKLFGIPLLDSEGRYSNQEIRKENDIKYCIWCGKDISGKKRKFCCKDHWLNFYHEYLERFDWNHIRNRILKRDHYTCQYCIKKDQTTIPISRSKLEVHHIIPRCQGGSDLDDNLITLCIECHKIETKKLYTNNKQQTKIDKFIGE